MKKGDRKKASANLRAVQVLFYVDGCIINTRTVNLGATTFVRCAVRIRTIGVVFLSGSRIEAPEMWCCADKPRFNPKNGRLWQNLPIFEGWGDVSV